MTWSGDLVPILDVHNTGSDGGYAFVSENTSAWRVFDGLYDNTGWQGHINGVYTLGYKFANQTRVNRYFIYKGTLNLTQAPRSWYFQGSNNGTNWTTLDTQMNNTDLVKGGKYYFTFNNTDSYYYYQIYILNNNGSTYTTVNEMNFQQLIDAPPVISNLSAIYNTSTTNITVSATLTDADGDSIKYKILVNGIQAYPSSGYTSPVANGTTINVDVLASYFTKKVNTITFIANDGIMDTPMPVTTTYTKFEKFLFADKNGILYNYNSTSGNFVSIGSVLNFSVATTQQKKDYKNLCLTNGNSDLSFLNVTTISNKWDINTKGKLKIIVVREN